VSKANLLKGRHSQILLNQIQHQNLKARAVDIRNIKEKPIKKSNRNKCRKTLRERFEGGRNN